MKAYSPPTNKGRHVAGHDVHHASADVPRILANVIVRKLRKSARQFARLELRRALGE